jgi:polysaccharide pyruvyl transferase WcaK-like protein
MKVILPRVILGNRGDLASRWGLLYALQTFNCEAVTVFAHTQEDVPKLDQTVIPYGKVRNLIPTRDGWKAFQQADTVFWGVGLDLQDDSSLAKLMYLNLAFWSYRLMGLRVVAMFQGAGPLETRLGRFLARQILRSIDLFVARDPGTHKLVNLLYPDLRSVVAHDAIFLPDLERELSPRSDADNFLCEVLPKDGRPVIGFNLRQWFHFASNILPYQFSKKKYHQRSQDRMSDLLQSAVQVIQDLQIQGNVLLISAYQPGSLPWEDDLYWLAQIKDRFRENQNVVLMNQPIGIPTYFDLMSRLDLMIGMRLHSTLIALRFGVPSLNLSYTLKGQAIMNHLGLSNNVVKLESFTNDPDVVTRRAMQILDQCNEERIRTEKAVTCAIEKNMKILHQFFAA